MKQFRISIMSERQCHDVARQKINYDDIETIDL